MKRLHTLLIAGLVSALVTHGHPADAFADKGRSRQMGQVQNHAQFRSAIQSQGNFQPNLGNNLTKQLNANQGQRIMANQKLDLSNRQLTRQLSDQSLRNLNNLPTQNSLGSAPTRGQGNLAKAHSALSKSAAVSSVLPQYPKLSQTIAKHPFAPGLLAGVHFAPHHCHAPLTWNLWCGYFPTPCHWWWNYCPGLHACTPAQYNYWNWYYLPCPTIVVNGIVQSNARWYVGVSGMLLPGSGLGIDSVAAGSPAEGAGLQPGMVIASMNGVALNSESDLERAMSTSNGVLDLQIVTGANQAPTAIRVQMVLVTSISR